MYQAQSVLDQHHPHIVTQEFAISSKIIFVRGYRTVRQPLELEAYGFSKSQWRVPGLALPVHLTDGGRPIVYAYRANKPRVRRDRAGTTKTLKYEIPAVAGMVVDCPPPCQPTLGDPSVPLRITEGQKKAESPALRR